MMEMELLLVVMVLKEFRTMLLGTDLHIFTDHKNLTYHNLNSQQVLRWHLFIEDYMPPFHYLPGQQNVVADAFSHLPCNNSFGMEGKKPLRSLLDDKEMLDCYLNLPPINVMQNPLQYRWIQQNQFENALLNQL